MWYLHLQYNGTQQHAGRTSTTTLECRLTNSVACLEAVSEACIPLWQLQTIQQVYALCCSTQQGHIRLCCHLSTICIALISNVCTKPISNSNDGVLSCKHACGASLVHYNLVSMHVGNTGSSECTAALQPDATHLLSDKQALQHFQTSKRRQHHQMQAHQQRRGLEA